MMKMCKAKKGEAMADFLNSEDEDTRKRRQKKSREKVHGAKRKKLLKRMTYITEHVGDNSIFEEE